MELNDTRGEEWDLLFDALEQEQRALAGEMSEAMVTELPAYRAFDGTELLDTVLLQLRQVLGRARGREHLVDGRDLLDLAAVGASRARHAVPVDDMLRAWRVCIQITVARARALGAELGLSDGAVLAFVESTLAAADAAMVITAAAHRDTEGAMVRRDQERRAAYIRGLLLGTLSRSQFDAGVERYSLDTAATYVAVRARPDSGRELIELERALGLSLVRGDRRCMATIIDGDLAGWILDRPKDSVLGVGGTGPARPLTAICESFRLASRALLTASAFGMSGLHDLPGLGVRAAIIADGDVGEALTDRYLAPVLADPAGSDLLATLRGYFEAGMHVERTAGELFIHPNTLRNRLTKFETITGTSLRDPLTALEVWWALERLGVSSRARSAAS
ncbi:MAG TPA: helix-turn-helix domain-containing protein [Solirubrobacteraceae bacterium]|jgi:hypothetical protein|nr:helix-turn-helix domain-containing protein [Solirubrobacteraceae bacterium]